MAKRIADKELTDRNWDQEDEEEEAGTFSIASEDVMKNRPIKKAKRRAPGAESEGSGAFKAFKGFSLAAGGVSGGGGAFGGFGNGAGFKPVSTLANGNGRPSPAVPSFASFAPAATGPTPTASPMFNGPAPSPPPPAEVTAKRANGAAASGQSPAPGREYSRQLTALNCSVRDWIVKHVDDNPLCDLNPIFRDYERHLASIERKYGAGAGPEAAVTQTPSPGTTAAPPPQSKDPESSAPSSAPTGVSFSFGKKVDSSVLGSLGPPGAPGSFSFSSQSGAGSLFGGATAAPPTAGFSFGGAKTPAASSQQAEDQNGGEEEEEPPKPVVTEVKEDDAFYSKKCKLFYKKENEFKEKGVGTLHLKEVSEGKTQLLVRADTNLGNILLNIMVPASMPCSRMGKNNVMVVCVPNPPVDDKNPTAPVPLLIRVKTAEDADELHRTLREKA